MGDTGRLAYCPGLHGQPAKSDQHRWDRVIPCGPIDPYSQHTYQLGSACSNQTQTSVPSMCYSLPTSSGALLMSPLTLPHHVFSSSLPLFLHLPFTVPFPLVLFARHLRFGLFMYTIFWVPYVGQLFVATFRMCSTYAGCSKCTMYIAYSILYKYSTLCVSCAWWLVCSLSTSSMLYTNNCASNAVATGEISKGRGISACLKLTKQSATLPRLVLGVGEGGDVLDE